MGDTACDSARSAHRQIDSDQRPSHAEPNVRLCTGGGSTDRRPLEECLVGPLHGRATGWKGAAGVATEIVDRGGRAGSVGGDLADPSTTGRIIDAAIALGPLACVVNNAGTPGEANTHRAHETPDDLWDETIRTNLTCVQRLIRAAIPELAESSTPNRSIVNLSSTAGQRVLPWYGAYCVSKAALEALTRQQALELAPMGIRVNAVSPGSTSTDTIVGTLGRVVDRTGVDAERLTRSDHPGVPRPRIRQICPVRAG